MTVRHLDLWYWWFFVKIFQPVYDYLVLKSLQVQQVSKQLPNYPPLSKPVEELLLLYGTSKGSMFVRVFGQVYVLRPVELMG